jgi:ABC-type transport system involved in multi-copper enzyme maturation permease subunit
MDNEVNFVAVVWHRTYRLLFSVRGVIALLMSVYMLVAGAYFLDALMEAGTVTGELYALFIDRPEMKFQWFFFDGALSKLVTIFVAPLFIFDAVSGDRSGERMGIVLSRPITRVRYMLFHLVSATLAFGIVFFGTLLPGYFLIQPQVPELTAGAYLATTVLMFLLGFFALCVALLVSTLARSNLVSFIVSFGLFSFLMLPNASKYSSDALLNLAKATPHYYSTYFTTNNLEAGLFIAYAVVVVLFALPFLALAIFKFRKEDL